MLSTPLVRSLCSLCPSAFSVDKFKIGVGCRPPGGNVRYSALEAGYACFGVPATQSAIADATARRSVATFCANLSMD